MDEVLIGALSGVMSRGLSRASNRVLSEVHVIYINPTIVSIF